MSSDQHDPVADGQRDDEDASAGTMPDHEDPHPSTGETPRRH
jgi:hypothetical protein